MAVLHAIGSVCMAILNVCENATILITEMIWATNNKYRALRQFCLQLSIA